MDHITANQQRLAYAKVCVKVEATKDIPRCIEVELRNGNCLQVIVEIPWMPSKRSHCRLFGHGIKDVL